MMEAFIVYSSTEFEGTFCQNIEVCIFSTTFKEESSSKMIM